MADIFTFKSPVLTTTQDIKLNRYEKTFTGKCSFDMRAYNADSATYTQQDYSKTIIQFSSPIGFLQFKIKNIYTKSYINFQFNIDNTGAGGSAGTYTVPVDNIELVPLAQKFIIGISNTSPKNVDYSLYNAALDVTNAEINFISDNTKTIYVAKNKFLHDSDIKIESFVKNENPRSFLNIYCEVKPHSFIGTTVAQAVGADVLGVLWDEVMRLLLIRYPSLTGPPEAFFINISQDIFFTGEFYK